MEKDGEEEMKAIIAVTVLISAFLVLLSAGNVRAPVHPSSADPSTVDESTVIVDAGQTLAEVNPLLFGQNYGPWMNTTEPFVELYQAAGVTLLRFPGGNWGDENDLFPNNLDDLAVLARQLNAQVSVQARSWRNGTPEKAAALVKYANIEKKFNFVYWEIGNEPDLYMGANRIQYEGDPVFDVNWYNAHFREMAEAMKAVDPTIKIVGPVVTGGWPQWMPAFIKANGDIVDVLSWHYYGAGNELTDAQVLQTPKDIEEQVNKIRGWWKDPQVNPLGYKRPAPPLFLSEYNVSWASRVRQQLGTQVGALWNAELLGRMANLSVEMGAHFALQETEWQGMIDPLKNPRPVYGVYQLYARWGTTQVKVSSPDERMLPVFASRSKDGTLTVMVINKDPDQARRITIELKNFHPAGKVTPYFQDETHLAAEQHSFMVNSSSFPYEFPAYSVTLLAIPGSNELPSVVWLGGGAVVIVIFAAFVAFQRSRRGGRHA